MRDLVSALGDAGADRLSVLGLSDDATDGDRGLWQCETLRAARVSGPKRLGFSPEFGRSLRQLDPDLVHSHGLWQWPSAAVDAWSRRTGRPHVVSPHGMLDPWAWNNSRWKKRVVLSLFEGRHLRSAACLHALNESEYGSIRCFGLRNPIAVIPNGVSIPEPLPSGVCKNPHIIFLGRIHPKKGLRELLVGFAKVSPKMRQDWCLVIAGWDDGGHRAGLEKLARELQIVDSVDFVGPQFGADKHSLLAQASAFVLPSFSEGLPIAVLEAWAYGLPVVITEQCNLPQGYAEGAALRIETAPESIGSGLEDLMRMTTNERLDMGARGRALVKRDFSWREIARQTMSVYEWALGGGVPPGCVRIP